MQDGNFVIYDHKPINHHEYRKAIWNTKMGQVNLNPILDFSKEDQNIHLND